MTRIFLIIGALFLALGLLYYAANKKVEVPATPKVESKPIEEVKDAREPVQPVVPDKQHSAPQKVQKPIKATTSVTEGKTDLQGEREAPTPRPDDQARQELEEEYGEVPSPENAPADPTHMIGGASVTWDPPKPPPPGTGKFGLPPE